MRELQQGESAQSILRCAMMFQHRRQEYRHPSCLVKHRWEHSPHWKEPVQLSMSKHQQVQMLEAGRLLCVLDAHIDNHARPLLSLRISILQRAVPFRMTSRFGRLSSLLQVENMLNCDDFHETIALCAHCLAPLLPLLRPRHYGKRPISVFTESRLAKKAVNRVPAPIPPPRRSASLIYLHHGPHRPYSEA